MTPEQIQQALREGIAALKAGRQDEARQRLTAVITADEHNEMGWLWLSGAVDSAADRRICLENVLAINPDNAAAQRGLAKLTPAPSSSPPLSPASAILHPERYAAATAVAPTPAPEMETAVAPPPITFAAQSQFDDVWNRSDEICPYCAHPVDMLQSACPGCKKSLIINQFRYPTHSVNLVIYWVLLAGIGQILLLKVLFLVIVEKQIVSAISNGVLILLFFTLAAGINFRQVWALYGSYVVLSLVLLFSLLTMFTPLDLSQVGAVQINENVGAVVGGFINRMGGFLDIFLLTAVLLGLFYGIARTGTDFERVRSRQIALVRKGLKEAPELSAAARNLAKQGMWAAAILHWQRAAAKEPTRWSHQYALGQGYAHLGFYERALDALQSARKLTSLPARQAEIDEMMTAVAQKQAAQSTTAAQ